MKHSCANNCFIIEYTFWNTNNALTKLSFEHFLEWNDVSRKIMIKETKPFKNEIMISSWDKCYMRYLIQIQTSSISFVHQTEQKKL